MTPKAAPKATGVAIVLALALIVLGVVFGRDALIAFGGVDGSPWVPRAIEGAMNATAQTWMLPAGIALGVLGLILLLIAVLPRRRTHRPSGTDGVWIGSTKHSRVSTVGRWASVADRTGSFVVGAVLVALGAAAVAWQRGVLPAQVRDARRTVEGWSPTDWDDQGWWSAALVAAAIVTVLVGLRWLYAHRPRSTKAVVATDSDDHAVVDLASATRHAAMEFASMPGIESASARIIRIGASRVVRISGVGDSADTADLVESAARLRESCSTALHGLAVQVQVLLTVTEASSQVRPVRSPRPR